MFSRWSRDTPFRQVLDEEKDDSSVDNLLPRSESAETTRTAEDWDLRPTQSRRSWPWAALNAILFLFSLTILGNRAYEKYAQAHNRN